MDILTSEDPISHSRGTYLPQEIKLNIARELHYNCASPGDPDHTQDLVALSMSEKSWRTAVLPYLYFHCEVGGRGNFALQNWVTRLLPHYGHFTRSIDVALCWMHSQHLPERERWLMEAGQNAISKPWEEARDALLAQLVAGLSNLETATITMFQCISTPGSTECSCLGYFGRMMESFGQHHMKSLTFHGIAVNFCPNIARSILSYSSNSLESVHFSDAIDGYPSQNQPFEEIAQLSGLRNLSISSTSFHSHDLGSLNWACSLGTITVTNEGANQITQPVPVHELNRFLDKISAGLHSLVLRDVSISSPAGVPLTILPQLRSVTVQSVRDTTFEVLTILKAHVFEALSIIVTPGVDPTPLLNGLTSGGFPGLKRIHIRCTEGWNAPVRWDTSIMAAIQASCGERDIELTVTKVKRQKSAKVRVRRPAQV